MQKNKSKEIYKTILVFLSITLLLSSIIVFVQDNKEDKELHCDSSILEYGNNLTKPLCYSQKELNVPPYIKT